MTCAKRNEFGARVEKQRIGTYEYRADPVIYDGRESIIDVAFVAYT